jgi:hypothetical protein
MSRSRKKTPIGGITTAVSEKKDKQLWHRKMRRAQRMNPEADLQEHEFSNPWQMDKDGKQYYPAGKSDYRWMGK